MTTDATAADGGADRAPLREGTSGGSRTVR